MLEERRQNLAETESWSYYNQEECLEEFLDGKGSFYEGNESNDITMIKIIMSVFKLLKL